MTRAYEIAIVIDPKMSDSEIERFLHTLRQLLGKHGVEIKEEDNWGRIPTAYKLKGNNEAYYIFMKAEIPSQNVVNLEQDLKLNEQVIRHLITIEE